MKFHGNFIGNDNYCIDKEWSGGDNQENFDKNKNKVPNDWYYNNKKIIYSYNSYGHRCREISELNLKNYILFTGCSHTEGVGLELEKTFSYIVSKTLDCDYYNLGITASGQDVLQYNLITWFNTIVENPKYVIIQWPDHSRFVSMVENTDNLIPNGTWNINENVAKFITYAELIGFNTARKHLTYNTLKQVIKVPVIHTIYGGLSGYDKSSIQFQIVDYARDLSHPGIETNKILAERIVNEIKNR